MAGAGRIFTSCRASLPAPMRLLRDAIVYLTCLHESGHAFGLPHTRAFPRTSCTASSTAETLPPIFGRYRDLLKDLRTDISTHSGISDADRVAFRQGSSDSVELRRQIMFCTQCGANLSDTARFCITILREIHNQQTIRPQYRRQPPLLRRNYAASNPKRKSPAFAPDSPSISVRISP